MQDELLTSAGPSIRRQFLLEGCARAAAQVFAAGDAIKTGYLAHPTGPVAPFAEAN